MMHLGNGDMENRRSIRELRSVTCHMGSHSVTCHPTQVNVPHLNPRHCITQGPWEPEMRGLNPVRVYIANTARFKPDSAVLGKNV